MSAVQTHGSATASSNAAAATRPTLAALPLGPLTQAVLYLREGDVAQLLRTEKELSASALDSSEFWRERCCSTFGRHVECIEVRTCSRKTLLARPFELKHVNTLEPAARGIIEQNRQQINAGAKVAPPVYV